MLKMKKHIVFLFILFGSIFIVGGAAIPILKNQEITHQAVIQHPGKLNSSELKLNLVEIKDKTGFTIGYSMKVPSVYCVENVCKIDTVQLFWNNVGVYKKFKLKQGVELEKAKGEFFNESDYARLQKILSDSDSPLKNVQLKAEIDEVHDVDAVAGATYLDANSTVKGALWTSYTMWHFVYGNVVGVMENLTAKSIDNEHLNSFLKDSTQQYKKFAMDVLKQRNVFNATTLQLIIEGTKAGNIDIQNTLDFFESSTTDVYVNSIRELYSTANGNQRMQCLNSMTKSNVVFSDDYLIGLFQISLTSKSYPEIDNLLDLFERKKNKTEKLNAILLPLLNIDKKLIARRIYWYLMNQQLKDIEFEKLNDFKNQNAELF